MDCSFSNDLHGDAFLGRGLKQIIRKIGTDLLENPGRRKVELSPNECAKPRDSSPWFEALTVLITKGTGSP